MDNSGKFVKVKDEPEWKIVNKWGIQLGARKFEVSLHQVMYGFRVRGGWVGEGTYEYDWCCGDSPLVIIATQKVMMSLIERGVQLKEIPTISRVKPWYNDPEFINRIDYLYGENILAELAKGLKESWGDES